MVYLWDTYLQCRVDFVKYHFEALGIGEKEESKEAGGNQASNHTPK